jgi:hypothetical protein
VKAGAGSWLCAVGGAWFLVLVRGGVRGGVAGASGPVKRAFLRGGLRDIIVLALGVVDRELMKFLLESWR